MFSMWARAPWARVAVLAFGAPLLLGALGPVSAAAAGHRMTPAYASDTQGDYIADFQPDVGLPALPCLTTNPIGCFTPTSIRPAYGLPAINDPHQNGAGRRIVIIEAFQSATIKADLGLFDVFMDLPDPTLDIRTPFGVSATDPGNLAGWSKETALDVEWAHAIAPKASLILVQAKSDQDVDMVAALRYAVAHNLGDVISMSFGEAETCADRGALAKQHAALEQARERGITVVASSGDQGAARKCPDGSLVFAPSTPASDPNVTAVGGTHLMAAPDGTYLSEVAWNTPPSTNPRAPMPGASGGGFSTVYHRPDYQAPFQPNKRSRGVPDVAYDADPTSGFIFTWNTHGFLASGTSAGTPQWAGIAALADQAGGHRLGLINTRLYKIARGDAYARAFHDVTTGNNTFGRFTGYAARKGWDPVTGLGSPNVANLLPLLRRSGDDERGGDGEG